MQRTFLGWNEPALPLAADILLDAYGGADEVRLDRVVVVLPGSRAGRRLKEILADRAAERGVRLVPPRIVTLGILPELLYESPDPMASAAVSRLAWVAALRETPAGVLSTVFARLPQGSSPDEWSGIARDLAALHREVARAGLRFGDVATQCRQAAARGSVTWDDARRWEVLARVQDAYAARLSATGLVDGDLARLEAIRAGSLHAERDLWLVGVSEMPEVVRRALQGGHERVHALVHAPADLRDAFDDFGCVVPDAWEDREIPLDEDALHVVEQPQDQADAVALCLAELHGARAPDEVSIGVPDPELLPWLEERLNGLGVPVRDAAGQDIRRTGPYRLLSGLAELVSGGRWEGLAALARHPDVGDWIRGEIGEASALAHPAGWLGPLDRWYQEHLPAVLPAGLGEEGFPGRHTPDGQVVYELLQLLGRRLPGSLAVGGKSKSDRTLRDWTTETLDLLARAYSHRDLDPSHPGDRRVVRSLGILAEAIQSFHAIPRDLDSECSAAAALKLFMEEAAGARIPERPDAAAVEVLGWLELHLDDAPAVILASVNDPWLPESVSADPFLPDALRRVLGLEDNRLRYARDAYRLTAMIHSTGFLRLVAGRRSSAGDPIRPSRLLLAADRVTVARRVLRFFGNDGTHTTEVEPAGDEAGSGRVSRFRLPPEEAIDPGAAPQSLRVTDFRRLLTDPYGFALGEYRGCRPLADHAREMDAMLFGNLAHRVLERFGSSEVVHLEDEHAVAERLHRLLDEEVRHRFGAGAGYAHPAVRLQVEQLRARLRRFAVWHVGWIGAGWRVRDVECTTPPGGADLDVDGMPVFLRARIDRIDHHPDRDEWAVFDYKTSEQGEGPEATHRKNRGQDWCDLQLPLYQWLLPRILNSAGVLVAPDASPDRIRVGYILLPRDLDQVGEAMAPWVESDFADALERARKVVRDLRSGPIRFDPSVRPRFPDPHTEALLGRGQFAAGADDGGEA